MEDARQLVVGAALMHGGRVLTARRTTPPEAAGRWELPGGKVEPGETPAEAVVREVREELGCATYVVGWLPGRVPIGQRLELAVALVELVDALAGSPTATEHDRLRWLGPEELDDVDWLEPDRPFVSPLREELLRRATSSASLERRGLLHDEHDALAVAEELRSRGHGAHVVRDRLAGEDDDEDQPWAVLTDAPDTDLESLVESHDGWLGASHDTSGRGLAPAPTPLPGAPRRRLGSGP